MKPNGTISLRTLRARHAETGKTIRQLRKELHVREIQIAHYRSLLSNKPTTQKRMNQPLAILIDLLSGQSTASSLSLRLNLSEAHVLAMLNRLQKDGKVESFTVAKCLLVWKLTGKGTEEAIASKPRRRRRTVTSPDRGLQSAP